ncbi:MAG: HPr family phosphocarrier protein [Oleispira antarctica]|uniref:Phosphoryl carrier protein n=1 Tax=Oleispira antarctica RB-8 TaxID=698738 RepID=R4YK87_OLEAN|nr:HPr family phosphocarrier protein [Oleispira antarctica]MBQ0791094.1 HPr family phosphocarrier protein [Oleispira antarctica]CCK74615.1 Phosphoryl carrier protein [Oleispira antarctica RB-8]
MIKTNTLIINKLGLHARAASKLVTTASSFSSQIKIGHETQMADAKSIMAVMMLAACKGTELCLEIEGHDQDQACAAVLDLINRRFDEDE